MPATPEKTIVLVTGASSGIGRAIAIALARKGAVLHLPGRDPDRLENVAWAVRDAGAEAVVHPTDLTRDEGIERLAAALSTPSSRLDVLVHSAGDVALGPVESAPIADLDRQYTINVRAPFLLTQKLIAPLRAARGQIVFVNSGAGLNARPGWSQYAITKHGLKALADSLREELRTDGVRVLSLFPGRTATAMQEEVHRFEGKPYDPGRFLQPEDLAAQVRTALSLPSNAEVTELVVRPTT